MKKFNSSVTIEELKLAYARWAKKNFQANLQFELTTSKDLKVKVEELQNERLRMADYDVLKMRCEQLSSDLTTVEHQRLESERKFVLEKSGK